MVTAYTADLYEGDVSFQDFVVRCARAFGPLWAMQDQPLTAPIPEKFEPSGYHFRELAFAQAELAQIEGWDDAEADRRAQLAYDRKLRLDEEYLVNIATRQQRYVDMLDRVKDWTPPTADHAELKRFMVKQLEGSIDSDYGQDYPSPPQRQTGVEYKKQQLDSALRNISYHTEGDQRERQSAEDRTKWVGALLQNLAEYSGAIDG
jgi:hypothetical protein